MSAVVKVEMSDATQPLVTLAHGGGGRAMRQLIEGMLVPAFSNPMLASMEDQARVSLAELASLGDRLAFTTDTYVVSPIEFPGGDIGKLAVCGTVNDLAVAGARPLYFRVGLFSRRASSWPHWRDRTEHGKAAREAGVAIVTGDTKVVERGAADRVFINTAGIGVMPVGINIGATRAASADVGHRERHSWAIMASRYCWHETNSLSRLRCAVTASLCIGS